MDLYISINEDNRVIAVGSTPVGTNPIFVEQVDEDFLLNPSAFFYEDGKLVKNEEHLLIQAKQAKDQEFNSLCNQRIIAGFDYEIGGITYHFSYDSEAQGNFQGAVTIFEKGLAQEINWTVQEDGVYKRIPITPELLDKLLLAILIHKDSNITYYREVLMPQVNSAQSLEEVEAVTWKQEI